MSNLIRLFKIYILETMNKELISASGTYLHLTEEDENFNEIIIQDNNL